MAAWSASRSNVLCWGSSLELHAVMQRFPQVTNRYLNSGLRSPLLLLQTLHLSLLLQHRSLKHSFGDCCFFRELQCRVPGPVKRWDRWSMVLTLFTACCTQHLQCASQKALLAEAKQMHVCGKSSKVTCSLLWLIWEINKIVNYSASTFLPVLPCCVLRSELSKSLIFKKSRIFV